MLPSISHSEMNLFEEHNLKLTPRDYPRANNISFEKVFALLQEKFNQVREYMTLQAHKMSSKASEPKNSRDTTKARRGLRNENRG